MVSIHYKTNVKAMSRWCLFTHLLEVAFPELVCSHTRNINVDCDSDTRHFISPAVFTALLDYLVLAVNKQSKTKIFRHLIELFDMFPLSKQRDPSSCKNNAAFTPVRIPKVLT